MEQVKALAKKHKIRLTKNVGGRRMQKTEAELRANIAKKVVGANVRKINNSAKLAVYKAENEMNNVFFNANNVPFNLRNKTKNAINHKFKTTLINNVNAPPAMKRSAVALGTRISGYIKSGKFLKAVWTLASLMSAVLVYQNPRAADDYLNHFSTIPFLRAVGRSNDGRVPGMFARAMSLFGTSATFSQGTYEYMMSTLPNNVHRRSVAGLTLNYLAMVILTLIAILPWENKNRNYSYRLLVFIFKNVEKHFPTIVKVVYDVTVERKETSKRRGRTLMRTVLPLILKESLG
jgi:hypothetical protein